MPAGLEVMRKESRIKFIDNSWPEGHRIKEFLWTAKIAEGTLWFFFHLTTENYDQDGPGVEGPGVGRDADWKSPTAWGNYHACTLSATNWGDNAGFPVGSWRKFSLNKLDGMEFIVDPLPVKSPDEEQRAFHIYLLGHDEVADHRIKFTRDDKSGLFDIHWTGKIALTYSGDREFRHRFEARFFGLDAPAILKKRPFRLLSWIAP
jgi:hypothetical protein